MNAVPMKEERLLRVILAPVISEKATMLADKREQVIFRVASDATKPEIKAAVELLFKVQVKDVKFRPGTEIGDYQVKLRNLHRFLEDGDKAKVTMRFRGREHAHRERGLELLERIEKDLEDVSQVEQRPMMEGRQMVMVLGPKRK